MHLRHGEIDIVARDGSLLIFIEVRARSTDRFGSSRECLHPAKLRRLRRAVAVYLAHAPAVRHRLDLAAVTLTGGTDQVVKFEWIKNLTG